MKKILSVLGITALAIVMSCSDSFFETAPPGQARPDQFNTKQGIDRLLIGAYSLLDGIGASSDGGRGTGEGAAVSNWIYGDVSSDDAFYSGYTGGYVFERHAILPIIGQFDEKWRAMYDGINRCNTVLKTIAETPNLDEASIQSFTAQTRFLRAFYYSELRIIFKNVPYVDETTTDTRLPNNSDVWFEIEDDLKFAIDNLPPSQEQVGRINSWGAKAFLAKAYLYQNKHSEAKILLDDIISNGITSNGLRYDLNDCYRDAFDIDKKNSKESVFAVQMSVNDGSSESDNGNYGDVTNHPVFPEAGTCCGSNRPSQNLVNAFKTGVDGLPLFETFNETDLKSDDQVPANEPFTPDTTTPVDPRLDWTVGRRGIPYLDWGPAPGAPDWSGGGGFYGGPYSPIKSMFKKSEKADYTAANGWTSGVTAQNFTVIRFSEVLLWAAECEIEAGNLDAAREYVNRVRRRAKNGCFVMEVDSEGKPTGNPAANYHVEEYVNFPDKSYALQAVQFEHRLELAMEGKRFFNLVRWGVAEPTINEYLQEEKTKRPQLSGGVFRAGVHEYFPIPQQQIITSYVDGTPTLTQNSGY